MLVMDNSELAPNMALGSVEFDGLRQFFGCWLEYLFDDLSGAAGEDGVAHFAAF